ncbi:MAG TPA: hypothetical protein VGR81_05000 [Candidatus Acidoferrales bacterium]|nr:hypothetical protein [Candidatus Acidoferrales bacterium]
MWWFRTNMREWQEKLKYVARAERDSVARRQHLREMMERIESQEEIGFLKGEFPGVFN